MVFFIFFNIWIFFQLYSRADNALNASKFRLNLAKSDFDHLQDISIIKSQADDLLTKISNKQKKVAKNSHMSAKELSKVQKLITQEIVLRTGIKMVFLRI